MAPHQRGVSGRSTAAPAPSGGVQPSTPIRLLRGLWRRITQPTAVLGLLILSLLALPFAMASTLSGAMAAQMEVQADEISTLASSIRSYYADNIISRLQASGGQAVFSENYHQIPGGIPIPATLAIELGDLFDSANADRRISYSFISDYPFAKRVSPPLDGFEMEAIKAFRSNPELDRYTRLKQSWLGQPSFRVATPVLMRKACVSCHNVHPDSPKRDWKVGDVRGIQEVTVRGLDIKGLGRFGYLMAYMGLVGLVSVGAAAAFQRQASALERINRRLQDSNERESEMGDQLRSQVEELRLLSAVAEHATFGVSIADMRQDDYPLIYVNEAFSHITGYPRDKATGFNCRFLRGPDTDPQVVAAIISAIREGKPFHGELVNYRMDGTRFWNRLTLYPVGGSTGKPDFYVGNQMDVTALHSARELNLDQLIQLGAPTAAAQGSLDELLAHQSALQTSLRSQGLLTVELETFFAAERRTLETLQARLQTTGNVIQQIRPEQHPPGRGVSNQEERLP
ncbi:DUF3365 domain-containing protein [Vulcanococcus limneticus]|uniref:c-type heme family protein n=1 Tax=Vulcanococcus limneticus TaxID=2170428 RepID=UPI00398BF9D9